MERKPLAEVLEEHREELMALPGVVGTALGERQGERCILIFVAQKTTDLLGPLPSAPQGYSVVVEETGQFRARTDKPG